MSEAVAQPRRGDPRLRLLLGLYAAMYIAANVGSVMAPRLVKRSPELLLASSSRIRHLLFAVPAGISPGAYAAIGFARLMLAAAVCYLLGRWFGTRGFAWLDRQLGDRRPATLRWLEAATDHVGWLFVVLMPGSNIVCALVGHRRMSPKLFFPLASLGIALRLWWVWLAAKHWDHELKRALDWIGRYQWWLVGAFVAVTIVQALRRSRAIERAARRTETAD